MQRYWIAAALAVGLAGCARQDESTRARTETTAEEIDRDRRDWENRMRERLDKLERDIEAKKAETRENWRQGKIRTREEYQERVSELDRLKAESREKYAQAKAATKEGWREFKAEMEKAADKLESSWNRFLEDLKT